jgi:hypothetical protein
MAADRHPARPHARQTTKQLPTPLGWADVLKTKQLRILAFGDSTTEGWIQTAWKKTPFTPQLEARLREKLGPQGIQVQVTNGGASSSWGAAARAHGSWRAAPPPLQTSSSLSLPTANSNRLPPPPTHTHLLPS